MRPWSERPYDEAALLNPSFLACLHWSAAAAYQGEFEGLEAQVLPLSLAFVIPTFVLHGPTRESLPATVKTSLPVWLEEHPLLRSQIPQRATVLVPYVREGLLFGALHDLVRVTGAGIDAVDRGKEVQGVMKKSSEEVVACMKASGFAGRWLARAGSAESVMTLLGVRP